MKDLVRAELLKLRTTRMFVGNAIVAVAFVPVFVAIAIRTAGRSDVSPELTTSEGLRNVMSSASSGALIVLIVGILIVAGEFRHNTATSTFLITPDRAKVMRAKLIATTLVGAAVGLAGVAITLIIALPWLAAKDVEVNLLSADVGLVLLGSLAATALYAVVGVGVGSLIRNQTTTVVLALVWVFVVEGLLVSLVPDVGRWLPGGAQLALSGAATAKGGLLPMWGAALLLTGYGLTLATAGSRFVIRRDVS